MPFDLEKVLGVFDTLLNAALKAGLFSHHKVAAQAIDAHADLTAAVQEQKIKKAAELANQIGQSAGPANATNLRPALSDKENSNDGQ